MSEPPQVLKWPIPDIWDVRFRAVKFGGGNAAGLALSGPYNRLLSGGPITLAETTDVAP